MPIDLAAPSGHQSHQYDCLYRARGDEVNEYRPVFTGDVFTKVRTFSPATEKWKLRDVVVVQHPCALRDDGVNLAHRKFPNTQNNL